MTSLSLLDWVQAGGRPSRARLLRWRKESRRILRESARWHGCAAATLLERAGELRWQVQTGRPVSAVVPEAFAIAVAAVRHALGIDLYPVQVVGALALAAGGIAEMQTGEGKTLTAILPAFAHALAGRGCHVVTANDYLAERDSEWTRPVFERLGMSVGCVLSTVPASARRREYACDVTYGTSREFGFDYLRDRMSRAAAALTQRSSGPLPLQRELWFGLIDEADSILIDDARTPLVISQASLAEDWPADLPRWCDEIAGTLRRDEHFEFDEERRVAWLTDGGCRSILFAAKPPTLGSLDIEQIYRQVEWAITAQNGFVRDRHYLVGPRGIGLLDESTGRVMEGRQWQSGLHQAIEARERVAITPVTQTVAQITVQRLFRQYRRLAGMTGTALPVSSELRRTFGLVTTAIPTHRPCLRQSWKTRIFATRAAKWEAVAGSLPALRAAGRAVLIGTPSVASSEELSNVLTRHGLPHRVLNARFDRQEADIIARAGEGLQVTIATNMAGRGTDIRLDETVARSGGLHVIATELHSSGRIDRQLIGRSARQGDPGTCQTFLSLEDELFQALPPDELAAHRQRAMPDANGEVSAAWLDLFRDTQQLLERRHARERRDLMRIEHDRVTLCETLGLEPCLQVYE